MARGRFGKGRGPIETWKWLVPLIMVTVLGGAVWAAQRSASGKSKPSPRHQEWVAVKHDNRTVQCFVVYPQVKEKALAVLIIHENQGLTDWVRGLADQIAEAGYIAIAPDLLSEMAPNSGGTKDFSSPNAATEAIYKLPQSQVTADLQSVADYVIKLPACNGKLVVAGFCWGGSQSFEFATNRQDLAAAYVFYGTAPTDINQLRRINCPVYGFYAGDDARVTSTLDQTIPQMKEAGKTFEPVVYPKAGHAFMRLGEEAKKGDPNRTARDEAWKRWMDLLKKI
jgi:carboxymethylenebutenolidase